MALKPEVIDRRRRPSPARRRHAKAAVARLRRRAERLDPEAAPVAVRRGYTS